MAIIMTIGLVLMIVDTHWALGMSLTSAHLILTTLWCKYQVHLPCLAIPIWQMRTLRFKGSRSVPEVARPVSKWCDGEVGPGSLSSESRPQLFCSMFSTGLHVHAEWIIFTIWMVSHQIGIALLVIGIGFLVIAYFFSDFNQQSYRLILLFLMAVILLFPCRWTHLGFFFLLYFKRKFTI